MLFAACTHTGKRRIINEDCIYFPEDRNVPQIAVVADGMGGHNAGEVASSLAVKSILETFSNLKNSDIEDKEIRASLVKANEDVLRASYENVDYIGMGTTLTLAVLRDDILSIGHVGDSRAYLLNERGLKLVTRDHSYVQELIDNGLITEDEALVHPRRNIITRALGISMKLEIDIFNAPWRMGDIALLCSDGLTQHVLFGEIERVLKNPGFTLQQKADALFSLAMERGGTDNISVIIVENG
jgi:serine/threonine protein phosphatase PrpC